MNASHAGLTLERWMQFDFDRQVLMIANELHRAAKLTADSDRERRRNGLERVYALVDLTIAANPSTTRRRELLRWREQLGHAYLSPVVTASFDRALLRALLQLAPGAAAQIPHVAA